jgi:peptide-methionine (R)-S-oxide reductase
MSEPGKLGTSDPKLMPIPESDQEWRERLDPKAFDVLRRAGTERPFIGKYVDTDTDGIYRCAGCGQQLFASDTKFHSGCGWPSFTEALPEAVRLLEDHSFGMHRVEVRCSRCDSHLGHVFEDGPIDRGGLRWCINSVSIDLDEESK